MEGVPVFRPTMAEFSDMSKFVNSVFDQVAPYGMFKVIPPPEWHPTRDPRKYDKIDDMLIPTPILQMLSGRQGTFVATNVERPTLTVGAYRTLAEAAARDASIDGK